MAEKYFEFFLFVVQCAKQYCCPLPLFLCRELTILKYKLLFITRTKYLPERTVLIFSYAELSSLVNKEYYCKRIVTKTER
jgi:hypothetical protein